MKKKEFQSETKLCIKLCNIQFKKDAEKTKIKPVVQDKVKKEIKAIVQKKKKDKSNTQNIAPKIKKQKKIINKAVPQEQKIIIKPEEKKKIQNLQVNKNYATSAEELTKQYMDDNIAKIIKLLEDNLYYPRRARKKGITGKVIVSFTLGVDSRVYNIIVLDFDNKILSRAAIKTIEDLSGDFPKSKYELKLKIPIVYSLK